MLSKNRSPVVFEVSSTLIMWTHLDSRDKSLNLNLLKIKKGEFLTNWWNKNIVPADVFTVKVTWSWSCWLDYYLMEAWWSLTAESSDGQLDWRIRFTTLEGWSKHRWVTPAQNYRFIHHSIMVMVVWLHIRFPQSGIVLHVSQFLCRRGVLLVWCPVTDLCHRSCTKLNKISAGTIVVIIVLILFLNLLKSTWSMIQLPTKSKHRIRGCCFLKYTDFKPETS